MSNMESSRHKVSPTTESAYYINETQPSVLITKGRSSSNSSTRRQAQQSSQTFANSTNDAHKIPKTIRLQQIIIDLIIIVATFLIFIFVYLFVDPKLANLTCDQSDVFYPYKEDTVPFWAVGIYGVLAPLFIILIVEFGRAKNPLNPSSKTSIRSSLIDIYNSSSLFVLGIALTLVLTEIGKRWVGRLRPHFIAVCQPNLSILNCSIPSTVSGSTYTAIYTGGPSFCLNSDSGSIKEARLSFPSGHSSFSTFCMLYLIVYVEARWLSFRLRYLKVLLQAAAFIAAYVTSVSRVSDYHHRGSDVLGGVALGVIIALFLAYVVGKDVFATSKETNRE